MAISKIYTDEDAARRHLEKLNWPDGPQCPHCGSIDSATKLKGRSTRPGVYKCRECEKPFSVTVGTVFERSHIKLNLWLYAVHLLTASKKGISSHQLHRMLGVTYKTAWFMSHRIRAAMAEANPSALGGAGKTVEADETYFGDKDRITKRTKHGKSGHASKRSVVALVERGGNVRMFHVERATAENIRDVIVRNVDRKTDLMTDESRLYVETGKEFADHQTVHHSSGEYARYAADRVIHTNTVENVFSVFKRGMRGIYQHCGEAHLHRYLSEFEFRYNTRAITDAERADEALKGIEGKRLTYRRPDESANA